MRFVAVPVLFMLSCVALGQFEASVSGQVLDAATGEAVPFATVTVRESTTDSVITGVIADEQGRFTVAGLPEGRFQVGAAASGYATDSEELVVGGLNPVYDLGTIALARSAQRPIESVVVVGQQTAAGTTIDRRVYSMEDNIVGASGSLLDAMRGLPGLTVDQEGRVLLRGSDQVSVLIDGKYSSLAGFGSQSGLDSVPAANIDRIEIINNPSAAFDAAGMAGVINVIYRDDVEAGLNIEAGLTVGSGTLSKQKADLPTELGSFSQNRKIVPSLNLTFNGPDRRFFLLSEFLIQDDLPNNEFTTRYYDDGRVILSQVPENRDQEQYIINGGIERFFENDRSFSFSTVIDFETHTDIAQVPFIDQATMTRNRYWFWREKEDTTW
jgi:hypothetical protein